jgi:recombination protein RecR
MNIPESIEEVVSALSQIQGIGNKTSFRYVNSLIKWNNEQRTHLARSIEKLNELKFCRDCGFFSEEELCLICLDQNRIEENNICVIESISDLIAIENSKQFKGLYFILGGVLNPLMGIGPNELKIPKLIEKIKVNNIKRILLAVNPSVEGDATCSYIKSKLTNEEYIVERIGFGIPIGSNLEFLDSLTISRALENRKSF